MPNIGLFEVLAALAAADVVASTALVLQANHFLSFWPFRRAPVQLSEIGGPKPPQPWDE